MADKEGPSRQQIIDGGICELAEREPGSIRLMSDEERQQTIRKTLASAPTPEAIWIFACGSLIWNPALDYAEKVRCTVAGHHRSFCFWTVFGRGSVDYPGLMLGLEPGGNSNGLAYRIEHAKLQTELDILFRRELMSYVYLPTWVEVRLPDQSDRTISALAFRVDPAHERFCGDIDEATVVKHIATATGNFGRNCDYLFQLNENLAALDFADESLIALEQKVREYQRCS